MQVPDARLYIAEALIGNDRFVLTGKALQKSITKFMNTLLAITWNQYRKTINKEIHTMEPVVMQIKVQFEHMSLPYLTTQIPHDLRINPELKADRYHLKATEIIVLVHLIRKATTLLVKYNNMDTVSMLQGWTTELNGMLMALRKDTLSKAAQSRLKYLYAIENL